MEGIQRKEIDHAKPTNRPGDRPRPGVAGWSVVPTASDAEKRPQGSFATAKSWRDFSDRLPADAELLGWFGPKPRRGGVVLHKGQLCVDRDTKDSMPDGSAPCEETDHGSHEFFLCAAEAKPSHDHDAKIDYLTCGSFVRLANPRCLLDWVGDLPRWEDGAAKTAATPDVETTALSGGTIRDTLIAQGWKSIGVHGNREDFSRPGAAHPSRCDASLFDGSSFRVWSTAAMAPSPVQNPEPPPAPVIKSAAELAEEDPQRGDDHIASYAEVRRQREAVLRGSRGVQPATVRADHRADFARQVRCLLVQCALP